MSSQPNYVKNEFDSRIERFDATWQKGVIPDIGDFLLSEESEPEVERRLDLAAELVMIDLEYHWRRVTEQSSGTATPAERTDDPKCPIAKRPFVEDYISRFPELRAGKLTKVIASEYHTRHRWGDRPDHDEYLQRFPEHARALSKALRGVDQRLPRSSRGDRLKIRCPHCQAPIDSTALDMSGEIECTSCHCAFGLVGDDPSSRRIARGGTLGSFQLMERLGSGSFGTVWKARDTQLDRDVAIKIPHREQFQPHQVEQFLREARTAAQLNHPSIVSVHEVGRDAEIVFVVSDLIDGTPLSDWMKERCLSAREATVLCQTIALALDHAHQAGVIHRDLKPANIIMDSDDQPHLTDFGLARREVGEVTVTRDGQLLGTPAYMSPEQARGESHQADRRCDIYSLGVILYELLTGTLPFRGTPLMLARQVVHDEPPSLRKLDHSIPRDLETICLKCLEKRADQRYQTAVELAADLRRLLSNEPIHAKRPNYFDRFAKFTRRHWNVVVLIIVILFLSVIALSVGAVLILQQRDAAQAAAADARTQRVRADENLRQARAAVDRMFIRVAEGLADRPHMEQLRRGLLEDAIVFYRRFLREESKDHEIRLETAYVYDRLAEIHETLGDNQNRLANRQEQHRIVQSLCDEYPEETRYRELLARSNAAVGKALLSLNRLVEGESQLNAALDEWKRLSADQPTNPAYRVEIAAWHFNSVNLLLSRADPAVGVRLVREGIRVLDDIRRDYPEYPIDKALIAKGHWMLAHYLQGLLHFAEAEVHYRTALRLDRTQFHTDRLAMLLLMRHALDEAEELSQTAIEKYRHECELHPDATSPARKLMWHLEVMRDILTARGRWKEAQQFGREELRIGTKWYSRFPDDKEYAVIFAWSTYELGHVFFGAGHYNHAADAYRQAISLFEALAEQYPDIPRHMNHLAWVLSTCPVKECRRPRRAVQHAQRALELSPENPDYWSVLARAQYVAGDCAAAINSIEGAGKCPGDRLPSDTKLVLAMAHHQMGDREPGHKIYEETIKELKQPTTYSLWYTMEFRLLRAEADKMFSAPP